jgi:UDP-N-acetylglucosamine/UDP-N-acetylgalactosamine diphosphorylase
VLPFHVARKAVAEASPNDPRGRAAAAPDEPNAVKLEAFIFDAFALADDQAALGVDRASEFAAVKNAPGSATDSPEAARTAMLQLGAQWLRDAGAIVLGDCGAEVSGRASYAGEGLEDVAKGKTFDATTAPCLVDHDHDD